MSMAGMFPICVVNRLAPVDISSKIWFFLFEEQPTFERSISALRSFSIDLKVALMKYEEASKQAHNKNKPNNCIEKNQRRIVIE